MNRNKIVSTVKRQEEEKVGFSLKLPISVAKEIETINDMVLDGDNVEYYHKMLDTKKQINNFLKD